MPTYDYVCTACKVEHEIFHGMDEARKKCPSCGELKLRRDWRQAAAFHNQMSPMHPRLNRGTGNTGKRKSK